MTPTANSEDFKQQRDEIGKTRKLLPFGEKANRFISRDPIYDAKINILEGSIRSSKTWALNVKLLRWLCKYRVAGKRIFTGVSKQAVYDHVLCDLFEMIGEKNYHYNRQSGELLLFGSKWLVIGAGDEGSEKRIRGETVGIAVCDEIVLMPRNFFLMLLSRLSPEGARLFGTTNPESPYHWLKTDVIDNPDYTHGLGQDVWSQRWLLTDNPNLDKKYIDFLDRSYVGVWHARYVEGLWVLAENSIYSDMLTPATWYKDSELPADLFSRSGHVDHFVSLDVGTVHEQAAGDYWDDGKTLYMQEEFAWDSRRESRQLTNGEYADAMIFGCKTANFDWPGFTGGHGRPVDINRVDRRNWPIVICDPAAASFKVELTSRGVLVVDAKNEVKDGIRRVASMLSQGKLRINERCKNARMEMESYVWDEKAAKRGVEQPLKDHDHHPDQIRYAVETKIDNWRLAA
jgi:hypothetical protein